MVASLRRCTREQLNFVLTGRDLCTIAGEPLVLAILRLCADEPARAWLLALLSRERRHDLSLPAKAVLLRALHEQRKEFRLALPTMRAITSIWLSTFGDELTLLKVRLVLSSGQRLRRMHSTRISLFLLLVATMQ